MRLSTGELVFVVIHGVTCGNRVNLGTRTAPAERANVRGIRGLATTQLFKGYVMTSTDSSATPTSVYKYYDENNLLLYVGITGRGMARNIEHNQSKIWWQYVARQEIEHLPSRAAAQSLERELIRSYRPPFNVQHNLGHRELQEMYFRFRASRTDPSRLSGKRVLVLDTFMPEDRRAVLLSRDYDAPIIGRITGYTEKFHHSVFGASGKLKSVDFSGVQLRVEIQLKKPGVPMSAFAKWAHTPGDASGYLLKMVGLHIAKAGDRP